MEKNSYLYTGSPIRPRYNLNIGDKALECDKDFDVEITDNVNVGTAHVTIKGKGKFKGVIERTFEILPVPARSLSFFADNTEFDYTGEPCIMKVAVRFGDVLLVEGKDYDVEYINNTEPGTASVKLIFKGNFYGTMSIPFTIFGSAAVEEPKKPESNPEPKTEPIPEPEEDDTVYDELENLSELTEAQITLGESTVIRGAAKGGKAPYSYAVYYRKSTEDKWYTLQRFTPDPDAEMTPVKATRYIVLIKVRDSRGEVAKKYFKLAVREPDQT